MIYFLILVKNVLAQKTTAKVCAKINNEKIISFPANYTHNSATYNLTDYLTSFTGLADPKVCKQLKEFSNRNYQKDGPSCRETFGAHFEKRILLVNLQDKKFMISQMILKAEICNVPGIILLNDKKDIRVERGKLIVRLLVDANY